MWPGNITQTCQKDKENATGNSVFREKKTKKKTLKDFARLIAVQYVVI